MNGVSATTSSRLELANRKPWPATQPRSSRVATWLSFSMPSATVSRPSVVAEHHDGAGQFGSAVLLGQPADERAIDLQDVDREPVQVRERRIAHAEVVDREAHAERLQFAEALQVDLGVLHDRALGQLDHEVAGIEPRDLERMAHVRDQVALLQVATRDVDRHAQARAGFDGIAPVADLGARVDEHAATRARRCGRIPRRSR